MLNVTTELGVCRKSSALGRFADESCERTIKTQVTFIAVQGVGWVRGVMKSEGKCVFSMDVHKCTWISPDGKTQNQIDNILVGRRRRRSNVLKVRSFRTADCGTDHYLAVAEVRETLAMNEQITHIFHMERFEQYCVEISNRFAGLEFLDAEVDL